MCARVRVCVCARACVDVRVGRSLVSGARGRLIPKHLCMCLIIIIIIIIIVIIIIIIDVVSLFYYM